MKIITLYANHAPVNYYSCIVNNKTFRRLEQLSNIGGFKRFEIDYEDDTTKEATDKNLIFSVFLSKVFPKVTQNDINI